MSLDFLIQSEQNKNVAGNREALSIEAAAALEKLSEHNWSHPERPVSCHFGNMHSLKNGVYAHNFLKSVVPVGAIEFVEEVMRQAYGINRLIPQNIPEPLNAPEFLGRKVAFIDGVEGVPAQMDTWGTDRLFVKSASTIKCDYAGVYKRGDTLPRTADRLLVSEALVLTSEWRVFVLRGAVKDIRFYDGIIYNVPNKDEVGEMAARISNTLRSCTLDVGVTDTGDTVLIEAHNFISCGLYGASLPLCMYTAAYRQELELNGLDLYELPVFVSW